MAQNTIQMSAIAPFFFSLKWKPCGNMSVPNSLLGKKQENNRKVFIYIIIADIDLPKTVLSNMVKFLVKSIHRFLCNCMEYESTYLKQNSGDD